MISEIEFARDFASFWRLATPTMDGFVRRLNKGAYTRDFLPMGARVSPNRRSLVNELAFDALCRLIGAQKADEKVESIEDFVLASSRAGLDDASDGFSKDETQDAVEQVRRLQLRLLAGQGLTRIECKPPFPGCGLVDKCEGDVRVGSILYEVKAGDRPFRSVDFRQVLTYLALNYASSARAILRVGLINPRVGVSIELEAEDLCFEVAGRHPAQLLEFIAYSLSSGDVSR